MIWGEERRKVVMWYRRGIEGVRREEVKKG